MTLPRLPRLPRLIVAFLAAVLALATLTGVAHASGQWVQVSCENPNGSAANDNGWAGSFSGSVPDGSTDSASCSPGHPMSVSLSDSSAAGQDDSANVTYTPPSGSTLAGGEIDISGSAPGANSSGSGALGTVEVYSPAIVYPSNVQYQCEAGQSCASGFSNQTVTLPSGSGGIVSLQAGCGGGAACNEGGANGVWSSAELNSADLLLANDSVPTGSDFTGTLLGSDPPASSSLDFTAADPDGPGVYTVAVAIDGNSVYSQTPSTNNGACVSEGTYTGTSAMEFDSAQPCPQEESVSVPVSTSGLAPGSHQVSVTVTDAAGNQATVLDQEFTIPAPVTTPAPSGTAKKLAREVKAQFEMRWTWRGDLSRVLAVSAKRLPHNATVLLSDSGRGAPKIRARHASARYFGVLMHDLEKLRFRPGNQLTISVEVRGAATERILVTIRRDKLPTFVLEKYR